ncbi:hypothetical protein ACOMHN_040376 [Nucella lapillus]
MSRNTTTTTTTTTAATSTTAQNAVQQYDNFLDNPFHLATYVVLPAMIFVYGGCCVIYCVAKLHRYCRRRARRRAKRRLIQKDELDSEEDCNNAFTKAVPPRQTSLSVVEFREPTPEPVKQKPIKPKPVKQQQQQPVKKQPPAVFPKPAVYPKPEASPNLPAASGRQQRNNSSRASSSYMSSARAVQPGYLKSQDLQQHMKHLDDQLKAAFHMISEEPKGIQSRPDLCASTNENKRSITKRPGKSWIHFYVSDQ